MLLFATADQNRLLSALPAQERDHLAHYLEPVVLRSGDILCEAGTVPSHLYFPTSAVLSILHLMESGASSELAAVGNEGMVGISLLMGGEATGARTVVQAAGHSHRLRADLMRQALLHGESAMSLLLRYTQAFMVQMAQNAICNRYHKIDQQLCRWLLQNFDRAGSAEVAITHGMLAAILGVRREGVSEAAARLQQAGAIGCRRGQMRMLDRGLLESMACDCYRAMRVEFSRLLPAQQTSGSRCAGREVRSWQ